jgi:hypothetical protein
MLLPSFIYLPHPDEFAQNDLILPWDSERQYIVGELARSQGVRTPILSHVVPIVHLCHNWTSLDAAVAGVRRRWQRLFPDEPDEDRPDFQEAFNELMPSSDASHHL